MILARTADSVPWNQSIFRLFLLGLLLISVAHAAYFLLVGIDHPILDYHSFRQSQTAITAYWMWRDGFQLAYETPVLGYPWSIPFEFPLFQGITAFLRNIGVPIEVGGRLVAFGFYVATLYPLWILTKALKLKTWTWWIISILFMSSPLYVYWSRTVMIESLALFFSVYALALIALYLDWPELITLVLALVAGSLAVITKATTFPAYAFLAGLLIFAKGYSDLREGISIQRIGISALAVVALAIPMAIGLLWVWYTDQIKLQNPFGVQLTSANLAGWNFGTWVERTSAFFWRGVVLDRVLPDIFGYAPWLATIAALAALLSPPYRIPMLAAIAGFILPFLLFTNVHLVHSYYQNANGLLALAAAGLGIAAIADLGKPLIAGTILAAVSIGQLSYFQKNYAGVIAADLTKSPIYSISQAVKSNVSPEEVILVLGQDWSSDIPYQSERKALALPNWFSLSLTSQALEDPERFLDGKKLGGIVYCTTVGYNEKTALVESFVSGRRVLADNGVCKLLSPTR